MTHFSFSKMLADLQARGVALSVELTTTVVGTSVVPFKRVHMRGGHILPHDHDGLKRHRDQLIALLESRGAFEMSVGDTQEQNERAPVSPVMPTTVGTIAARQTGKTWSDSALRAERRAEDKRRKRAQEKAKAKEPKLHALTRNETGNRFGKLLVVGRNLPSVSGPVMWDCLCDCGAKCVVAGCRLRGTKSRGGTRSCGCLSGTPSRDWSALDWTKSTKELAQETGAAVATIWKWRRKIERQNALVVEAK